MPSSRRRGRNRGLSSRLDRNQPPGSGQIDLGSDRALRGSICYHPGVRALPLLLLATAGFAASAADRQLLDEVVAVVEARSITLSEVAADGPSASTSRRRVSAATS